MGRDFFFLTPQRACEARTLLARETLRLLLRCLIADFKKKKRTVLRHSQRRDA